MAAVTIRYDADPSEALEGTSRLEEALDGIGNKLEDVDRAGEDAGAGLGEGLSDAAGGAEDAVDGIDEISESTGGAGLNARAMGSVFKQVLDGDIAGAARAAVPLLSALGPAAAIAGVTAFAGLSLIQQAIQDSSGAAKVSGEDAAKWARSWVDAGAEVIGSAQLVAEVRAIAEDPDRYEQAKKNAEDWGVTVSTAMRAMAGDALALETAQSSLNAKIEQTNNVVVDSSETLADAYGDREALVEVTNRGTASLEAIRAAMAAGQAIAKDTSDALLGIVQSAGSASLEVDDLGNKLYTLPDGTKVVVDAETGLASQNVNTFRGDVDKIPEQVSTELLVEKSQAERDLDRFIDKAQRRRIRIPIQGVDELGRRID